jgi:hypothetical protein
MGAALKMSPKMAESMRVDAMVGAWLLTFGMMYLDAIA